MKTINLNYTITTKEHYLKYKDFIEGIEEKDLFYIVKDLYKDIEDLQNKFNNDIHLNNINMGLIDSKFKEVMYLIKDKIRKIENNKTYLCLSLSESCSILKHILIYRVLKIKPYFEEDILNYKELLKHWFILPKKIQYPKTKKGFGLDIWFLYNKDKWILKGGLK
jgi:hypothetical protein